MILGIKGIEESWFYQDILAEGESKGLAKGRIEVARSFLVQLGTHHYSGEPTPEVRAAIEAITDLGRIESLMKRLLEVSSWDEFLEALQED